MLIRDFTAILGAWLHLPTRDIAACLAAARRAALVPSASAALTAAHVASGLIAVMVSSLDAACRLPGALGETCDMSLEALEGIDPLDIMPREGFGQLVGTTAGAVSTNGYLTMAETLGAGLARHTANFGQISLDRLSLQMHGTGLVGVVEAVTPQGRLAWRFTRGGLPTPVEGLRREVSVGAGVLSGLAFVLSAEAARG